MFIEVVRRNVEFPPLDPVSIPETAVVEDIVTQVTAISGGPDSLLYSITDGNVGGAFDINSNTGTIFVSAPLDFETVPQYSLTIRATSDVTSNSATAVQVITIVDVNEPPFFITACVQNDSCVFTVMENQPAGTLVGTIVAEDPDSASFSNNMLSYSLSPATLPFQVSSNGDIVTTQPLDHENTTSYSFSLVVQDSGTPPLSAVVNILVLVANQDENSPPMFRGPCSVDVFENIDIGSAVLQCEAVDTDTDGITVTNLHYEIVSGNVGNTFQFDPTYGAGVIATAGLLDREVMERYMLTITATDDGGLVASTNVIINIIDQNDNAPQCMAPINPVLITIDQLNSRSKIVTTIIAVDLDIGENAISLFSLESVERDVSGISTQVIVRVTDNLSTSLTSTCNVTVQFEMSCAIQEYAIDSNSGELTSQLLCSVEVDPPTIEVNLNANLRLLCPIVRNVPVSYLWLQNETDITGSAIALADSEDAGALLLLGVTFENSGDYVCRAESTIGTLMSQPAVLSVLGKLR